MGFTSRSEHRSEHRSSPPTPSSVVGRNELKVSGDSKYLVDFTVRETEAVRAGEHERIQLDMTRRSTVPRKPLPGPIGFDLRAYSTKRHPDVGHGDMSRLMDSAPDTDFQALRRDVHSALTSYMASHLRGTGAGHGLDAPNPQA